MLISDWLIKCLYSILEKEAVEENDDDEMTGDDQRQDSANNVFEFHENRGRNIALCHR